MSRGIRNGRSPLLVIRSMDVGLRMAALVLVFLIVSVAIWFGLFVLFVPAVCLLVAGCIGPRSKGGWIWSDLRFPSGIRAVSRAIRKLLVVGLVLLGAWQVLGVFGNALSFEAFGKRRVEDQKRVASPDGNWDLVVVRVPGGFVGDSDCFDFYMSRKGTDWRSDEAALILRYVDDDDIFGPEWPKARWVDAKKVEIDLANAGGVIWDYTSLVSPSEGIWIEAQLHDAGLTKAQLTSIESHH